MNAYSIDLRERVVKAYLNKEGTQEEIGKRFSVNRNTVYNWVKQYKAKGHVKAKEYKRGPEPLITIEKLMVLKNITKKFPDATLEEYSEYYFQETNSIVSPTTIFRALKKLRITRKKSKFLHHKEIAKELNC